MCVSFAIGDDSSSSGPWRIIYEALCNDEARVSVYFGNVSAVGGWKVVRATREFRGFRESYVGIYGDAQNDGSGC